MPIYSFENFRYFSFSLEFLLVDVEKLFVVVNQVFADVRFAGSASKVRGFKSVDGQQGRTPDRSQVVVGHQVHGTFGGDCIQVTDDSAQSLVV